ncbi:hypothetical protein ZOSMA_385G00060 [Zostera marina]|uniref:Uncharacterized protein n=1 Tax=Zostera marina TaxID=29655 RepID=A0A0K9P7C4_ZOSMR|nr:hypothetical protein ZOSMA_385G00060 [Zostera marina]
MQDWSFYRISSIEEGSSSLTCCSFLRKKKLKEMTR